MKQTTNPDGSATCVFDRCDIAVLRHRYEQYQCFASEPSYQYGFTSKEEKDCKLYEKLMELMRQVCPKEVWQGL